MTLFRPWESSTGPRSAEGKVTASRNAYKGGERGMLRELARVLRPVDNGKAGRKPKRGKSAIAARKAPKGPRDAILVLDALIHYGNMVRGTLERRMNGADGVA